MSATLPPVIAALVALLVLVGAGLALIGSIGLLRLRTFYERLHPPTLATTLGLGSILVASMLLFSVLQSRVVIHEIVIAVFIVFTTPVTYMLLVRAARHRDQAAARNRASSRG
ncbi:MAG TPA: monovalent cation/H(+) antiporter subunit G [Casimicrobiaceae bacterium]|nr:monovalent cation/H(+) antiporter subunit G [Casimicrobiaceae bacterium]